MMRINRSRRNGPKFRRRRHEFEFRKARPVLIWVVEIAAVILLALFLVWSFFFRTSMIGNAMSDTLESSDVVLVNRLIYKISSPSRGDVVAFLPKGNEKSHYYIRRVVGIPGDTILIEDGELYVNGEVYDIPGTGDEITVAGLAEEELTLGDDEYFVIGDNPNSSEDSRHSSVGMVSKEDMEGVVWFVISPRSHIGSVS